MSLEVPVEGLLRPPKRRGSSMRGLVKKYVVAGGCWKSVVAAVVAAVVAVGSWKGG